MLVATGIEIQIFVIVIFIFRSRNLSESTRFHDTNEPVECSKASTCTKLHSAFTTAKA